MEMFLSFFFLFNAVVVVVSLLLLLLLLRRSGESTSMFAGSRESCDDLRDRGKRSRSQNFERSR